MEGYSCYFVIKFQACHCDETLLGRSSRNTFILCFDLKLKSVFKCFIVQRIIKSILQGIMKVHLGKTILDDGYQNTG